ncbi:fimbrial protein [Xenorhabdus sp. 12]|uniref:Fimbrial protein n=1 Tax=Xenorhabdus santafensis TaxID=2582833 RepID=A0ABU4S913_9GAMM|nr:fimbrial protein [Xenorhabdus sp. 12]MDX7987256.1 fimbrial protein [Xenorhabdus sp. 12]
MFIFYKKYSLLLAAISVLIGMSINDSYAGSCHLRKGFSVQGHKSSNVTSTVGRENSVGNSIWFRQMDIVGESYSCSSPEEIVWEVKGHSRIMRGGDEATYDTGVSGIDMRIRIHDKGKQAELAFVKTQHLTGSGFIKPIEITARVSDLKIYSSTFEDINFIPSTCHLKNNEDIIVKMDKIGTRDFSGINSTAGEKPFDINLDCNARTPIGIVLKATSSGSTDNVLAAEQGNDAAEGVGIQVLYQDQPVIFDSLIKLGISELGYYSIPFKARYIQTAGHITAGKVNATATLYINYP